ncbi:MAG TPA: M1 family metallopeptidase [Bacteroidia bacterium]|nr:M1 family metallopeptidase [Bacteroidia bacterium]
MKKCFPLILTLLTVQLFAQRAYFQQDVAYTIEVRLNDSKHELSGFETIVYKNNSPDQLSFIYMHLWPNAYRDNNTALGKQTKEDGSLFFYYSEEEDRGKIDSLDFKVDGTAAVLAYDSIHKDIAKLLLPVPLSPGGQISITTPFRVKIPSGKISRLGHVGQQYQITQWYPKPAVYDQNGWNQFPYLNQGEFYSEFGTYDVFITLPKNYVLGSTGDLQDNPDEKRFLDSLAAATKEIKSYDAKDLVFPESSAQWKTLHYRQEHVHDFAWFCDKRYHVLKGEIELPHTKRKVTTWVMYTNKSAHLWENAIGYMNDAIYYYSLWNGDYAYNACTAVDGALSAGGGMEYPNITVIGGVLSPRMLDLVITHEVGHNWFYGMLGSNERRYPWMDEGINSANEMRYMMTKYPNVKLTEGLPLLKLFDLERYKQKAQYYQLYAFCARQHIDQPDNLPADEYTQINYGSIVYMKSAVAFNYLRAYLGDSIYDKAFQTYFERWKWKHPQPADMKNVFVEVTEKNLDWLFDDLIGTTKQLDYKIAGVKKEADGYVVRIKNCGEINSPVLITAVKDGASMKSVWVEGFAGEKEIQFSGTDYDVFVIDRGEWMPEINRKNNSADAKRIFKKAEPLRLQIIGSLDNPSRTQLFWSPALGYNKYDQFMLGAAFYNYFLPGKKFEWSIMPMYSFGAKTGVGHADAFYHIYPGKIFQQISVGANANSYHYYTLKDTDYPSAATVRPGVPFRFIKIAPEINFDIRKKRARSPISQSVKLRAIWLQTDERIYSPTTWIVNNSSAIAVGYTEVTSSAQRLFYELTYSLDAKRSIHPYDFDVKLQRGDDMMKAQLTANYHVTIKNKAIDIRFFGGVFLDNTNAGPYRFRMSSWGPLGTGNHDYLFDHIFLGRSENDGLFAQQMAVEDGGFKIYSPLGQSATWMSAINLRVPLPGNNWFLKRIKFYWNAGIYEEAGSDFLYEGGVQFSLFGIGNGIFDIYFPLVHSKSIQNYYDVNSLKYGNKIRFVLALETLNPLRIIRKEIF